MAAEQWSKINKIAEDIDVDLADETALKSLLTQVLSMLPKPDVGKVQGFEDRHVGKPVQWDGEKEEKFKTWSETFTSFMARAGDKVWRKIIKEL